MSSEDSDSDVDDITKLPEVEIPKQKVVAGAKHIQDLKDSLGLVQFQTKKENRIRKRKARKARLKEASGGDLIQTLASKAKPREAPVVIVYNDPKNRKRKAKADEANEQSHFDEVSMKQARFDVFKFGVAGMKKNEQQDANVSLAIKLGAKPPKNKCYEYNEFKEMRKKEKDDKNVRQEEERINGGVKLIKKSTTENNKSKLPKTKSSTGKNSKIGKTGKNSKIGKIGSFDGGMLKISGKELAKMKKK